MTDIKSANDSLKKQTEYELLGQVLKQYLPAGSYMEIPTGTKLMADRDGGFHRVLFSGSTPTEIWSSDDWVDQANKEIKPIRFEDEAIKYNTVLPFVEMGANNGLGAFYDGAHYFLYSRAVDKEIIKEIEKALEDKGRKVHDRGAGLYIYESSDFESHFFDEDMRVKSDKMRQYGRESKPKQKSFNELMAAAKSTSNGRD